MRHDLQTVIDAIGGFVAVVGPGGTLDAVNDRWRHEVERLGISQFTHGSNYAANLTELIDAGDSRLEPVLNALKDVSLGTRQNFHCEYVGSGVLSGNDYSITLFALIIGGVRFVVVSAQDLTEVNALKNDSRQLHGNILCAQEDERRNIAREVHDSTAQSFVALKLTIAELERRARKLSVRDAEILDECNNAVDAILQEVRSFAFLYHPPSLAFHGLQKAMANLVSGFAARAGIDVQMEFADVEEASAPVSETLYRLAQEAFAAIHRHSEARRVNVRLVGTKRYLHLIISDDGKGFNDFDLQDSTVLGVGVGGMRNRVQELGGRYSINRAATGTTLCASMPRGE